MLEANRQTDIHTQTDRDTDRQIDRKTDRQADRDGLPPAGWGLLWLIYAPNLKFLTSL